LAREHDLGDGDLAFGTLYTLNKQKRWLLPNLIKKRICEYDPVRNDILEKGDQLSTVNDKLMIHMSEHERVPFSANCILYANSQMDPHVFQNIGHCFDAGSLIAWIQHRAHYGPVRGTTLLISCIFPLRLTYNSTWRVRN
jgi:hypothetical protein